TVGVDTGPGRPGLATRGDRAGRGEVILHDPNALPLAPVHRPGRSLAGLVIPHDGDALLDGRADGRSAALTAFHLALALRVDPRLTRAFAPARLVHLRLPAGVQVMEVAQRGVDHRADRAEGKAAAGRAPAGVSGGGHLGAGARGRRARRL